jgi:hypothetical protein
MGSGRWNLTASALLGATIGMAAAAWPVIRSGHAVHYDQVGLYAAIGAAVFVTLALLRNAFAG